MIIHLYKKRHNKLCKMFWTGSPPVFLVVVFSIFVAFIAPTTEASNQGHRRHRLHHGEEQRLSPKRHGREINIPPQFQSYIADNRGSDGFSIVPIADEKSMQQNLHKPEFVDCSNYRASIPEGEPVGTPVIKVAATDHDPPESGGMVTYSIVSGNEMLADFAVDEHTGWISTRKIFDRDEPAKEKEVYVTVQASDNGNPRLDAVCTLKVQITDINDNTAQFLLSRRFNQGSYVPEHEYHPNLDKYEYKESMPQDLGLGKVVMRISATDIDDGDNGTVVYAIQPHPQNPSDVDFFDISSTSGEITLKKRIGNKDRFQLRIVASDKGVPPNNAITDLSIVVAEPSQRPPEFINPPTLIRLDEYIYNVSIPVATLSARSNADDELVFFELVNGQSQHTNKELIFTLETEGRNTAHIKLDRQLDYESTAQYTLTIRAQNKYNLASETLLTVMVNDKNDEKPYFTEVTTGTVLENEPMGTVVMRVRAIDTDGTSPNNEVTYHLKRDEEDNFSIDERTGEIRTRKTFDREEKDTYQVIVYARDGAPSVKLNNGQPNERPQTLKITIADKNDNEPKFVKDEYVAEMSEDADLNRVVVEVRAKDLDTASVLQYTIIDGNVGEAFAIRSTSTSGVITVKNKLDFEVTREYELTVRASDSLHDTKTKVKIFIQNVNDEPPKFETMNSNTTIVEETIPQDCIFRVKAYDPDIGDRSVPQNISFFILNGKEHFSVGPDDGCVKVIKPLDREDKPFYQMVVGASDEWGLAPTKLSTYKDLIVNLIDINDNAPVLSSQNPVVWDENQPPGPITQLEATDADAPENGAPFYFAIDPRADPKIKEFFSIEGKTLRANKDEFDREEMKHYIVPIAITDSGLDRKTGTSELVVIIGDKNDNEMSDGESQIFVYKYKERNPFPIGRVYVVDLDDWDLPDKTFTLTTPNTHFTVDSDTGYINMKPSAESGVHLLAFKVEDSKWGSTVNAKVTVTVKEITDDAVDNSGSIRFMGTTKEAFIKPDKTTGISKKDKLQRELARIFDVPLENVDIFTVGNSPSISDMNFFDVRYSVHNSPYWKAEKLNGKLAASKDILEKQLELNIVMIGVDECLKEKHFCESSCSNTLAKSDIPLIIFTNTTSFVGVHAFVQPVCNCSAIQLPNNCDPNPCLNNGICHTIMTGGFRCECDPGLDGPRCETTSISMDGEGFAWFPSLTVCNDSSLQLEFMTAKSNGLLFYNGPIYQSTVTDFMSLELRNGKPRLLMDYGTGVSKLEMEHSSLLSDGLSHKVYITWNPSAISIRIDECRKNEGSCYRTARPIGANSQLNVNGPFQLGGVSFNPKSLQNAMRWADIPNSGDFFQGCIANLTFNGEFVNLGNPSYTTLNVSTCDSPITGVIVATLGVDYNFIIILLICIFVLILLVIAIVFYRKKRNYEEVKGELGDDVRENIINYSDEGGGEGDQTGYDLSVLMKPANGPTYGDKIPMDSLQPLGRIPTEDGPDISSFLQGNKHKVDNDPDGLPYDDVRNYAYEGDGNSMGSLSSLASTDDCDEDLNFDYLPTFGPRFKKLADMYGGQSSDDESYNRPPPEAWC